MRHARRRLAMVVTALLCAAPAAAQLQAHLVASGFNAPIAFVQDPSDPAVQVVVEQAGRIRVLRNGVVQPQDFLDLTPVVECCGEMGLLGFAFAPDYAATGRVYVNFTRRPDGHTVIARFRRSAPGALQADPGSRFDLVWPNGQPFIAQPFSNHNGGNLAFGPDGFLYIGMGDGGSGSDPLHHAQNPGSLLGKMLRINVSVSDADPQGYGVPPGNPFVGQPGVLGEIWSFGLRNPWRWSFDSPSRGGTGAMLIGDVGQGAWEEVDYEPPGRGGRNYGWRLREGAHDHAAGPAFSTPLVDPVHEYPHGEGRSITGGFVYRGSALGASFRGRYFFADFISSRIWSLELNLQGNGEASAAALIDHTADLGPAAANPSSFGVDASGEIYVVTYGGSIYRIGGAGLPSPPAPPAAPAPPANIAASDSDFDDDGRPDLVWQHDNGFLHVWFMNGSTRAGGDFLSPLRVDPTWQIADADDFDGDGQADLVWQHSPTGTLYLWLMQGRQLVAGVPLEPGSIDPAWRLAATGDFNRDGRADLLWQEVPGGRLMVWLMDGAVRQSTATLTPGQIDPDWRVAGTADLNQDGHIDILWQHIVTGGLMAWLMDGTSVGEVAPITPDNADPAWRLAAVADFDRDGLADFVFQHQTTGQLTLWFMNGSARRRSEPLTPAQVDPGWRIAGGK